MKSKREVEIGKKMSGEEKEEHHIKCDICSHPQWPM